MPRILESVRGIIEHGDNADRHTVEILASINDSICDLVEELQELGNILNSKLTRL